MKLIVRTALLAGIAISSVAAASPLERQIAAHLQKSVLTAKQPALVTARCDATLKLGKAARSALEARSGAATMERDFRAFDQLGLLLGDVSGEMYTVGQTSRTAAVRKAGEDCYTRISDELTAISLSRPIFDRLSAIPQAGLDKKSGFTLGKVLTNYKLSGVDRDAATRAKVEALQKELTEIGTRFAANIRDDKGDLAFSAAELEGVPADWLAARKPGADGLIHLTTDYPDVFPVLDFAKRRESRRKMAIFFRNRAHPANGPVLGEMLRKRHELARVLGYPDYATLITADKMVGSPAKVASFIDEVDAATRDAAAAEKAELLAFAKTVDPSIDQVQSWDGSYIINLLRKQKYAVDSQDVRQYFTYEKSRVGIFELMRDLFGAQIRPWKTATWSPEVTAWELLDKGKLVGRFYLDMHPRDGKYNHAAQFPIRTGVSGQQVPTAALITNFPATGPMDHEDVSTFLHEFGHLVHNLYSGNQQYASQSMGNLQWDFIEAPSQLLEEWVWDYDTLKRFASNPDGKPIPPELVAKMNAGRKFGEAISERGQLVLSAASLNYHNRDPNMDVKQLYDAQVARYSAFPPVPEFNNASNFGHLNGYSAIYYTYVWSKAIGKDLFTRFKTAGIRNPDVAMAYRRQVLEPGGSTDANLLIEDFLGRPLSLEAYKQSLRPAQGVVGN